MWKGMPIIRCTCEDELSSHLPRTCTSLEGEVSESKPMPDKSGLFAHVKALGDLQMRLADPAPIGRGRFSLEGDRFVALSSILAGEATSGKDSV